MRSTIATLTALLSIAAAQLTTKCNPMTQSCPANPALSTATFTSNFQAGDKSGWTPAAGTTLTYGTNGAEFTINTATNAPTLQTDFYIFFGYVEVSLRAAPGTGIVSSIVLSSDDLDEIDWEPDRFPGIRMLVKVGGEVNVVRGLTQRLSRNRGGKPNEVQTNYFGKGDTSSYDRATTVGVSAATTTFHTYAINWTPDYIQWLIDGTVVRTLNYADAKGGSTFPQTPCRVSLGNWAGGASVNEGTVEWAGGKTDFSQAPFTMNVQSVKIVNYNPADSYAFSDRSGAWKSINIVNPGAKPGVVGGSGSGSSSSSQPASTSSPASTTVAPPTTSATTSTTTTTVPSTTEQSSSTTEQSSSTTSTTETTLGVSITQTGLPSTNVGGAVSPTGSSNTTLISTSRSTSLAPAATTGADRNINGASGNTSGSKYLANSLAGFILAMVAILLM